jgi:hypothetical protein
MGHEQQIDHLCRIIALIIRRVTTIQQKEASS